MMGVRTFVAILAVVIAGWGMAANAQTAATPQPTIVAEQALAENAALLARSQALTAGERDQALRLFSTGFQLWQSGDFASAEVAFRRGLDIDPANVAANFYLGDCLRRRSSAEAATYFARAVQFGPDTAEGIRAQSALATLADAPLLLSHMSPADVSSALIGTWIVEAWNDQGLITITAIAGNQISLDGRFRCFRLRQGRIDGDEVVISASPGLACASLEIRGRLSRRDVIQGVGSFRVNGQPSGDTPNFTLVRQEATTR